MKNKKGFTLIEVTVAMMIFGVAIVALAGVWTAAQRYMTHSFKENYYKNTVTVAIKSMIDSDLSGVTRVDRYSPDTLAAAKNIESDTSTVAGCHPLVSGQPQQWYYYCLADATVDPVTGLKVRKLFLTRGTVSIPDSGCPSTNTANNWTITNNNYPTMGTTCGSGTNDVEVLAGITNDLATTPVFSMPTPDTLLVHLQVVRVPNGSNEKVIRAEVENVFKLSMPAN